MQQRCALKHSDQRTVQLRTRLPIGAREQLTKVQQQYTQQLGYQPSLSILMAIAVEQLAEALRRGKLPRHSALWLSKPKAEGLPVGEGAST